MRLLWGVVAKTAAPPGVRDALEVRPGSNDEILARAGPDRKPPETASPLAHISTSMGAIPVKEVSG